MDQSGTGGAGAGMSERSEACHHFWLEMRTNGPTLIAICQPCKQRGEFSMAEWECLAEQGQAKNKPVRV